MTREKADQILADLGLKLVPIYDLADLNTPKFWLAAYRSGHHAAWGWTWQWAFAEATQTAPF